MSNPGPSSAIAYSYRREQGKGTDHDQPHPGVDASEEPDPEAMARFMNFPEIVFLKIFNKLSVADLKNCRLTCTRWNYIILLAELPNIKSCFLFDGRKEDSVGSRCSEYMEESPTKNYNWSHMKFRRVSGRQTPWLFTHLEGDPYFTECITKFELLNCSLHWLTILQILLHLRNLYTFIDKQDMYCWDYQTFNAGIDEDELMANNQLFLELKNRNRVENLAGIRVVHVHRSQLAECTTYLKIFMLRCTNLLELEMTTDQNFAPQRATSFYTHLYGLLKKNRGTLKTLKFPYKLVCPTYDFRVTDEHHCFREFMTFVADRRWAETLKMEALENLQLQFGIVPVDNQDLKTKLVPFLESMPKLKKVVMGCLLLEAGMERFVDEYMRETLRSYFKTHFGIYINDAAGPPTIINFQGNLRTLSIQTFREMVKHLKDVIPLLGIEAYEDLQEFQYFSKNHAFRNFNIDLLTESFRNLTHLNLVDHNSRLETRHSCEALATIEDKDMQCIIGRLEKLESLQLITNMTYLTDKGLTGISAESCVRMQNRNSYVLQENDRKDGKPLSNLQNLKYLVLRGLGIKVTDVIAHFAFNDMSLLRKLHLYGSHQLSAASRSLLSQKFNSPNGCDLQIGAA